MMLYIDRCLQKLIQTQDLGKFYSPAPTFTLVTAMCALLTLQPLIGFSRPLYLANISDDKIVNVGKC